MKKAKSSKINNRTNSTFSRLVQGWKNGEYDEDPIILVDEVEFLLK